jgi:uncharacterized protein (TIGR00369 family)
VTRHERLASLLEGVPYIRFLGMEATLEDERLTCILPFRQALVGNVMLPALHGGVIGAFLEMTALTELALRAPQAARRPRTIDVTVDYLRPGRAHTTLARARVQKAGRRIASVHVEAWQEDPERPVAALRGHFMLAHDEA